MNRKLSILWAVLCAVVVCAAPAPVVQESRTARGPVKDTAPFLRLSLSHPDSWTMVVVPDVQTYVVYDRNHGIFELMTAWIVDHLEPLRIQMVLFTGDLVDANDRGHTGRRRRCLIAREQWKAVSRMMERLDGQVPYVLCTGNHDYGPRPGADRTTYFNDYFPTDRNPLTRRHLIVCKRNAFGVTSLENAAYEFTAPAPDNRKFLIVSLQFAPTDEDLAWAKVLVDQPRYADHIVVLLTHSYLAWTGERLQTEKYGVNKQGGNAGEQIFRKLVYPAKNIRLVICGHICAKDQWERGVVFSTDKNSSGKTVAQMAFNTQYIGGGRLGNGGDGWLRLLEFMPDRRTVKATTFSPLFAISPSTWHLAWMRDARNEFTFTIE